MGAVGTDEHGKMLIKDFKAASVDTSQILITQKAKTGAAVCFSDKLGRRALYISPGANSLLSSEDISLAYLNQARIVHLSSFAHDRQFKLQATLSKEIDDSVKVSLAPGMLYAAKGLKALSPLLKKTYIAFMNREEIEHLTGRDFKSGAKKCLNAGCQIVVVTLGKGLAVGKSRTIVAYICNAEGEYEIESERRSSPPALESTGAGDAFAAGFLFGLLRSKKIEECGLLGDIMAGFAIKKMGARKGLPSLAQLSRRYLERSGQQL